MPGLEFFLPVTAEDEYEQRYAELARFAGAPVPEARFPGIPFLIVTSAQPLTSLRSGWHNPISAGVSQVRKKVLFDIP